MGLGRVRMADIDSRHRKDEVMAFARASIAPGTILYTDGDRLYNDLAAELQVTHERLVLIGAKDPAHRLLPAVHRVASLLKRWLAGTLHNGQSGAHLPYYLDEFTFRFNRRASRSRGLLFYRLLQQAVNTDPHPMYDLVDAPLTVRGRLESKGYAIHVFDRRHKRSSHFWHYGLPHLVRSADGMQFARHQHQPRCVPERQWRWPERVAEDQAMGPPSAVGPTPSAWAGLCQPQ